jgi:hypothetical protein
MKRSIYSALVLLLCFLPMQTQPRSTAQVTSQSEQLYGQFYNVNSHEEAYLEISPASGRLSILPSNRTFTFPWDSRYDPRTGTGYSLTGNSWDGEIQVLNTTNGTWSGTGVFTEFNDCNADYSIYDGVANKIYLFHGNQQALTHSLYEVDVKTGSATLIGDTGLSIRSVTVDRNKGVFYAAGSVADNPQFVGSFGPIWTPIIVSITPVPSTAANLPGYASVQLVSMLWPGSGIGDYKGIALSGDGSTLYLLCDLWQPIPPPNGILTATLFIIPVNNGVYRMVSLEKTGFSVQEIFSAPVP